MLSHGVFKYKEFISSSFSKFRETPKCSKTRYQVEWNHTDEIYWLSTGLCLCLCPIQEARSVPVLLVPPSGWSQTALGFR